MTSSATTPDTTQKPGEKRRERDASGRGGPRVDLRSRLRKALFGNLWRTLAGLLGVMQMLVLQWLAVVIFGSAGLGLGAGTALVLGVVLVAANLASVPLLRRARMHGGEAGRAARLYMAVGISTLLVGLAVAASWLGLFPVTRVIGWLGLGDEVAFTLFRVVSALWVGAVACSAVWAFSGGQKKIDRSRVRVPIEGLHDDHRGLEIVHLTDLHIGNGLEEERLDAVVADANALEADLIVLTGDLFDFDPAYVEDGARRLGALRARLGVFAVLGNHDTYTGTEHVVDCLSRLAPGIRLLRDEVVKLPLPKPLYIAGIEDPGRDWTNRSVHLEALDTLAERLPDDGPVLLLVHRPQAFPQAASLGFPLMLAGHTHGGQLALPFRRGQSLNLARVMTGYTRGIYQMNGSTLYVNRGIGVAGPAVRFNCTREMATIELV